MATQFDRLTQALVAVDPEAVGEILASCQDKRLATRLDHERNPAWKLALGKDRIPDRVACFTHLAKSGIRLSSTTAKGISLLQELRWADPAFAMALLSVPGMAARIQASLRRSSLAADSDLCEVRDWWQARIAQFRASQMDARLPSPPPAQAPRRSRM